MSGSGTNVVKILENQREKGGSCSYKVVLIFSDILDQSNEKCKAQLISSKYGVQYIHNDITEFYRRHGHQTKKDLSIRPKYDKATTDLIREYDLDLIALCGYMSILTAPLLEKYDGRVVNVHPADLSVREAGKRKFTGVNAVRDAILAGERALYSTTHVVRADVDYGEILMRSAPIEVVLPKDLNMADLRKSESSMLLRQVAEEHQARLKEKGDWVIYPKTLQMIGEGRYALDGKGNVYIDGEHAPNGLRL